VDRPAHIAEIQRTDLYPDAIPCLQTLARQGFSLGLAGNRPAAAETELARLGLPVAFVASSQRWGVEKPSPEFFARITSEARVPAQQIAYVGDRLDNDILPARQAGMFAVFLRRGPWGNIHAQRPEIALANAVIDSLHQLPTALESLVQPPG
jgi:FMN phosphatase YigB (HAD superfamily)